ncbi:MAG: DHH family phosphoesterase [Lachnospiraceae bacterium]|nr:DHH family phosphoesterase [Lachnospiraceae bacterium]
MAKKIRIKGRLRIYILLFIVLGVIMIAVNVPIYFFDFKVGIAVSVFLMLYFLALLAFWFYIRKNILEELVGFATQYGQVQKQILRDLRLPHALMDESGKILWTNEAFESVVGISQGYRKSITGLFPEITRDRFPTVDKSEEEEFQLQYEDRYFRVQIHRINITQMVESSAFIESTEENSYLLGIYLFDETALKIALQENDDQSLAVGLIYLDNYEEALDGVEEVRSSLLLALIERKINKYIASIDGIVKKIEKDKFMVILRKKAVMQLKEQRFDILEDVKTVNIGNERAITLSIGIGLGGLTYAQNVEFSRAAVDLALGRGGDQAVVKMPGQIQYFGGKSQQLEKNTRVKARVKAQALQEILSTKDQVFIMGHRNGDVDSFGAAIGIYCIANSMGKKSHIVLNSVTQSLQPIVDLFVGNDEYDSDLIVNSEQALAMVGGNAVLVVVDINRPSITECPELIKCCKAIVVLDHHRQGEETIENATLSYVEPYASSACEMVAEVLQYVENGIRLKSSEADALYGGIVMDTNSFVAKTGVRTFEAAAFLRRSGADVTRVRKLFRDDASEYMAKAEAIKDTVIYRNDYAIAVCDAAHCKSPTVVAAQAANELLNINGIKASFVFTDYNNTIYISARSIDEVNVQIIMERLGGGGHMNIAGAQFKDAKVEDVVEKLQQTLDEMAANGEI